MLNSSQGGLQVRGEQFKRKKVFCSIVKANAICCSISFCGFELTSFAGIRVNEIVYIRTQAYMWILGGGVVKRLKSQKIGYIAR